MESEQHFINKPYIQNKNFITQPKPSEGRIRQPDSIGLEMKKKLMDMQGECKINQVVYLKINYFKAIFLGVLLALSVVGLLLLKYYKKLRALSFYSQVRLFEINYATHIYVLGTDTNEQICQINKINYDSKQRIIFQFKKLKYQIHAQEYTPLGLRYIQTINSYRTQSFVKKGLEHQQAKERQILYGRNEHRVQVPHYFEYLFDVMTQPFFIFQYLVSVIYILQNVAVFGILMIAFGFITTSINYILMVRSYDQIKQTAQKQFQIQILRNGEWLQKTNKDLLPGDIYLPDGQIPCDSILINGELFVDQVNLTGENVPIAKFKLPTQSNVQDPTHWLFEGSKVQTRKQNVLALAVNIGFGSRRGSIIRKILTKIPKQPDFFKKLIYFLVQVLIVSIIVYFSTFTQMFSRKIDTIMIVFRFFDFVTYSFPAPYPIFFNLAYSFCLRRLKNQGIIGTQCQKTVESSRLRTICFDKTGTLTQNKMQIQKIYSFMRSDRVEEVSQQLQNFEIIQNLFASCHSVQLINGEYKGDQIDLKMFRHTKGAIESNHSKQSSSRQILVSGRRLQMLKINQYQSQFQSMSVLVKEVKSGRHFIFCKGSPEKIHLESNNKINDYDNFIKKLSLGGYRSIGFGFREIQGSSVQTILSAERSQYLKNTRILGVVTFINLVKNDAKSTITTLTEAEINTKIITGDNIFLGIQTAIFTGMIEAKDKVIVIEGRNYDSILNCCQVIQLQNKDGEFKQQRYKIQDFRFENKVGQVYAIDNDFITKRKDNFIHNRVKVFARISPQNKALIIRRHRQIIQTQHQIKSSWQKIIGQCHNKVGMVGDGANDLIAIKDADVGIGISSSDAIYSSSFAVQNLSQIVDIIKESKNTQRQIADLVQYFSILQFLSIINTLILTDDVSYTTSNQLIYKNFSSSLLICVLFCVSKFSGQMVKHSPNSNFMSLENHLVFWGNIIIFTVAEVASYQYYRQSPDFVANPNPVATFADGWNGVNNSGTVVFLMIIIIYSFLPAFIYRSHPWKQQIYKNIPLSFVIVVNVILVFTIYYTTKYLSFIDVVPIGTKQVTIVLLIMLLACVISLIYNSVIQKQAMHQNTTDSSSQVGSLINNKADFQSRS